jgi:hypothetical protein
VESLALIVSLIVLAIILLGLLSFLTFVRKPQSSPGKAFSLAVNAAGITSGAWFALLDIGMGARVIGALVCTASALSAIRLLKSFR